MTASQQPNTPATVPVGAITLENVRAALGDTDPRATNAGALQKRIGRGSTSTVQKYLEQLRAALVPAPAADNPVPSAPVDVVGAIWSVAWTAAQAQTSGRLAVVTQERDAARDRVTMLASDLEAATSELDKTNAEFEGLAAKTTAELTAARAKAAADLAAVTAKADQPAADLATAKVEIERLGADVKHVSELAKRDAELKDAAHDRQVASLTSQIGDLRAALFKGVSPAEGAEKGG